MKKRLNNQELFHFCEQFSILLHSGISCEEGLHLLYEDSKEPESRKILQQLIQDFEETGSFSLSLEKSGLFPDSMLSFISIGEETGCLDEVMTNLSYHYQQEIEVSENIKNAVTYPLLMLCMMTAVIVILLVKVLPVFKQVFNQMGMEMNTLSEGLLNTGAAISRYSVILILILLILAAVCIFLCFNRKGRAFMHQVSNHFPYVKEISISLDYARLTQAMYMGIHSGLEQYISMEMAQKLLSHPIVKEKAAKAYKLLSEGALLEDAFSQSGLFQGMDARLITVGLRAGSCDEVMLRLAEQYRENSLKITENIISIIEPTIVIVFSLFVGLVLLAVMMPLLGILSEIMI